ncbi:alpha/beta hydrolase [Planomonospora venezuelensis]|uniref:Acetyl esterase n=1 Tax=Planomonospora venezuelensis TaxID=1999 RepID=A0A841D8Q9_PLAVE|nr:alpha/beta hydrolase [Planomonospora venezuelensis]MBB5967022.1 acetyl esterase [Planomonospora venezuelensis]GIN01509.1 putative lipase/esterase [Planomonospora venezuelensis]
MALHPQAEAYLKLFPTDLGTPLAELTPEAIAQMRALDGFAEQRGPIAPLPVVRDEIAAAGTGEGAGGVPVRVYRPVDGDRPLPAIVYYHGGGWVFGSVARNDALARDLAVRNGAVVVSVDYRLAPEHPFPAAADDAWTALRDVFARPGAYGADPERIAVCGDSAGGNVAAVAARRARDAGLRLAHQVLVYPVLDVAMDTPSYRSYAAGFGLGADEMAWFVAQYGGDPADPALAPIRLADKSGLAPATVITAECDPLCDEGEAYAAQLAAAGVPVELRRYEGAIHGFFGLPGFFDQAIEAREYAAARLREAFA